MLGTRTYERAERSLSRAVARQRRARYRQRDYASYLRWMAVGYALADRWNLGR